MRIGVVEHEQCGSYSGRRTLCWIPDDWTEERFVAAVHAAKAAYLAFITAFRKVDPPKDSYHPGTPPPWERYPDQTVAQVKARYDAGVLLYQGWTKDREQAFRTFGSYLREQGCTPIWDHEPKDTVRLDWGHHHGLGLREGFDTTDPQDLPGPLEVDPDW